MNNIHITTSAAELFVRFPFALKDLFRATFKTAKWNPVEKAWTLKNTTANKNKLDAWKALAEGAASDAEVLDEAPLSDADLERVRAEVAALRERARALRAERARVAELLACLKAEVAAAKADVAAAQAELQKELKPVEDLCAELGVPGAIATLSRFVDRGLVLARDKDVFYGACRKLEAAYDEIKRRLKLDAPGLYKLGDASCNRLDKLRSLLEIYEYDVLDGVKAVRSSL